MGVSAKKLILGVGPAKVDPSLDFPFPQLDVREVRLGRKKSSAKGVFATTVVATLGPGQNGCCVVGKAPP